MSPQHSENFVHESNLCERTEKTTGLVTTMLIWHSFLSALLVQSKSSRSSTAISKMTGLLYRLLLLTSPVWHPVLQANLGQSRTCPIISKTPALVHRMKVLAFQVRHTVLVQVLSDRPKTCIEPGKMTRLSLRTRCPPARTRYAMLKVHPARSLRCSSSPSHGVLAVIPRAGLNRGGFHLVSTDRLCPRNRFRQARQLFLSFETSRASCARSFQA